MPSSRQRLHFPRLRVIELECFSLYARQPNIHVEMPDGVLCLAGANGIGKSTFLSAVNFALTGRVPTSWRSYSSANEYVEGSLAFSEKFFDGRISERDRASATIKLAFDVGEQTFTIIRGVFEPEGLRSFSLTRENDTAKEILFDGEERTDEDRQREYETRVASAVGLRSFQQFVFLQHFVLTFDESRKLLFWDKKALDAALFLAFGKDPELHEQADQYRRQMEREESKARNSKWQALRVKKRLDELKAIAGSDAAPKDIAAVEEDFDRLNERIAESAEALHSAEVNLRDAELKFVDASAALVAVKRAYAKEFDTHLTDGAHVRHHPVVMEAISKQPRCDLCGSHSAQVRATVEAKLASDSCPLCETALAKRVLPPDRYQTLRSLDEQIAAAQSNLEDSAAARDRAVALLQKAREKATVVENEFKDFETANEKTLAWVKGHELLLSGGVLDEINRLAEEMNQLEQQSKGEYEERTKWKTKLQRLHKSLQTSYRQTEREFVPQFRQLAERFLGIELDVNVESQDIQTTLVLELKSKARREVHQLSESQRFFLDIALRMALAQFASHDSSRATLFVDTPEGSLDIAYEARAGEMFAKFVENGHEILMTANINTSQLLRKLAKACGEERMTLARMTEWGELSEVQQEEEELFDGAYTAIEAALAGNESKL